MVRAIAGVIVGYVAMSAAVFTTFTGVYLWLGADGAFAPGAWTPSVAWLVWSIVLGLVAAIIGGIVCSLIAERGSKAPYVLAGLVLVIGLVSAGAAAVKPADPDKPPRTSEVGNFEAMMNAETPTWSLLVNPVIGVVGVLIGAQVSGRGADEP